MCVREKPHYILSNSASLDQFSTKNVYICSKIVLKIIGGKVKLLNFTVLSNTLFLQIRGSSTFCIKLVPLYVKFINLNAYGKFSALPILIIMESDFWLKSGDARIEQDP